MTISIKNFTSEDQVEDEIVSTPSTNSITFNTEDDVHEYFKPLMSYIAITHTLDDTYKKNYFPDDIELNNLIEEKKKSLAIDLKSPKSPEAIKHDFSITMDKLKQSQKKLEELLESLKEGKTVAEKSPFEEEEESPSLKSPESEIIPSNDKLKELLYQDLEKFDSKSPMVKLLKKIY